MKLKTKRKEISLLFMKRKLLLDSEIKSFYLKNTKLFQYF